MRVSVAFLFLVTLSWGQSSSMRAQMTPREIFYEPIDQAPAAAKKPAVKPKKPAAVKAVQTPVRADISTAVAQHGNEQGSETNQARHAAPDGTPVTVASSEVKNPLGMRYTVMKKMGSDSVEVSPTSVFHSGDRIQLKIEFNDSGYLYVVTRGSTGTWKPLYPDDKTVAGANRFARNKSYESRTFSFDQNAGAERLFIVYSREPQADLDQLIYNLGKSSKPASDKTLTSEPRDLKGPLMMASSRIDDAMVGRLRMEYSRDLIVEQPSEEKPAETGKHDYGVYLVNPHGQPDASVVADITLSHK